LDEAEEELERATAKVRRLRKQRKLWADRVTKMVRRGLTSLEELDRVEAEEAFIGAPVAVATVEPPPSFDLSSFSDVDLSALGFDFPVDSAGVFAGSSSNV
jgi:hypothetical protein